MVGEIERVFAELNRQSVRFLVAGGVAVVLHGYLRTTADLDLIVQLEPENILRALGALESLGYRPRAPVSPEDFADESVRESWIQEKNLQVFSFWSDQSPQLEVDLFVREPFDFEAVYKQTKETQLDKTSVRVVPRDILIEMKRRIGRPRDQMKPSQSEPSYPWSYEAHRRHQIRRGLEFSVIERLRWLETTMARLQNLVGRASGEVPASLAAD
jgi:hypothetical protein